MKKFVFVLVLLLLPALVIAEGADWSVLQPGWWNASPDAIIEARNQLTEHIVRNGLESAAPVITATPAAPVVTVTPAPESDTVSQSVNNLTADTNNFGNVMVNAIGSETKTLSHQVVSANFVYWKESTDTVYRFACVEILNTGNDYIYMDNCSFDFEDASGKIIDSENLFVGTTLNVIEPGKRGYYYVSSFNGGSFNAEIPYEEGYRLVANYSLRKSKKPYTPYDVVESNLATADYFGKKVPSVKGRIRNNTDEDDSMTYVCAVFKDSTGKVLFITGTNVTDLYSGITKGFSVDCSFATSPELEPDKIVTYEIYAGPNYYQF